MDWSNTENLERLGQYIDQGLSSAEAAAKFGQGVSRDAVIGAAHRQGWAFGKARPPREELPSLNALMVLGEPQEPFPVEAMACVTTLEDLAVTCLDQYRIVQNALEPMLQRVNADPDMMSQVMARLVSAECSRVLQAAMAQRHQEAKRKTGGGPLGERRATNAEAWAGAVADAIMDTFRLPSGKKLGDATRKDLQTAMSAYEIHASDATIKHRWMQLLAQSVPNDLTVRDVLTDERVKELREEARKGDA